MADNTILNSGSGGDTLRTEDRTTFKTPVSLIDVGGTGGSEAIVGDSGVALPVKGLGTAGSPATGVVTIQGVSSGTAVAVSGTFWQATQPVSLASVPSHAVTNAGTFAVQVDGSALTSLQLIDDAIYAEDAPAQAADKGVSILAVRRDTASSMVNNDGDYTNLIVNNENRLYVYDEAVSDSIVQFDETFDQPGSGFLIGAVRKDAATALVSDDGDVTPLQTDSNGYLRVSAPLGLTQSGTWNIGTLTTITDVVHVDDNSGSLTVDAPVGTPVFVRLSDGSSAISTLPVSLASVPTHAVTQSGTWTVTGAGGTFPVTGTFWPATQPVSVASGGIASGAFASGSIATGAIADMPVDDAAFTPATNRVMMAGFTFDDVSPDTVNEGDAGAGRMSANRCQYVNIRDNAGNERGVNVNASNQLAIAGPVTVVSGGIASGAIASGAIASGAIASGAIVDMLADDAAFTPGTSRVMPTGCQADETATDSVDEGDVGCPRMTLDRKQIVTTQPHTAGGCSPIKNLDVDETEDDIKTSAGQIYELYLFNTTNAIIYVKLYNATAANVTVGSTTPVMTIPVPGNNDTDGAGVVRNWPNGLAFDTAICIAATTGVADNDTGAPATNALIASGAYK